MRESDSNDARSDRGQVGIGTLIIFVAMVLVAAIAAAVLLSVAGSLQTQAEATGAESTAQVSDSLDVYTAVGTIEDDNEIPTLEITVGPGAGSSAIDLEEATINYVGPGGQTYLVLDDEDITVDGDDGTVLESGSDRATLSIDVEDAVDRPLEADDDASVTIMTGQGVQTTTAITVPSTLENEGSSVRL
ncbi:flagellin [Natronolimnobius sp. AArcel1]|uniref:archaellin/type IV pilin N-terminal domain-containing protein n=1 Tax=Natronolimnobius sp. AArcel1 TaxID=1679093 RepID=UPI0013EC919F|nr:archaellin/type IV pilin N-terminal domain-containing protein [Natronolimnobius sp. AArcel1]NGM70155.1 flagellin [Natronolimnobius sp. AArcel1]